MREKEKWKYNTFSIKYSNHKNLNNIILNKNCKKTKRNFNMLIKLIKRLIKIIDKSFKKVWREENSFTLTMKQVKILNLILKHKRNKILKNGQFKNYHNPNYYILKHQNKWIHQNIKFNNKWNKSNKNYPKPKITI